MQLLLTLPCTGGGHFPPPLPTLKPHSSLRSPSLCPIFISTWSHGQPLWPWPKKSTKKSFVFELYNLWRNDQKSPYNVGLRSMTAPKLCFHRQSISSGHQKIYFCPSKWIKKSILCLRKWKKWLFSKNLKYVICLNIGGGQDSCPGDPDSFGPHETIRST